MIVEEQGIGFRTGVQLPSGPLLPELRDVYLWTKGQYVLKRVGENFFSSIFFCIIGEKAILKLLAFDLFAGKVRLGYLFSIGNED